MCTTETYWHPNARGDRFIATITSPLSCGYDWEPPLSELISVRPGVPARLVVLDAADLPVRVVAVGADRPGIEGLARAERAGVPGFVVRLKDHPDRAEWDRALTKAVAAHEPDLVVSAGFMKILGPEFLAAFGGRVINTHPALLPAFPGAHAVADAVAYGVRVTGATVHLVDAGVDTGPIVAQEAVSVTPGEDVDALHERIKVVERRLLVDVIALLTRQGYTVHGRKVSIP
jgi:formyltetrahydrofolate-dependent phosphoribosylglycinamide formyltransferase